jgi:VCBS repeat protein
VGSNPTLTATHSKALLNESPKSGAKWAKPKIGILSCYRRHRQNRHASRSSEYGGSGGASLEGSSCVNCGSNFAGSTVRAVGAFGNSGEQSLVWQNAGTNAVTVYYYGYGGAIFQGLNVLNSGAGTAGWHVAGTGDFDGNGVPDLVWQNTATGQVNVNYYGGTGGATLTGYAVLNTGAGTAGWSVAAVADMNGDGCRT